MNTELRQQLLALGLILQDQADRLRKRTEKRLRRACKVDKTQGYDPPPEPQGAPLQGPAKPKGGGAKTRRCSTTTLQDARDAAKQAGFVFERYRSGHERWKHPDGRSISIPGGARKRHLSKAVTMTLKQQGLDL